MNVVMTYSTPRMLLIIPHYIYAVYILINTVVFSVLLKFLLFFRGEEEREAAKKCAKNVAKNDVQKCCRNIRV